MHLWIVRLSDLIVHRLYWAFCILHSDLHSSLSSPWTSLHVSTRKKTIDYKARLSLTQAQPNSKRNAKKCSSYKHVKHVLVSLCRYYEHFTAFLCFCFSSVLFVSPVTNQALRVYIFLFVYMRICSHFVQNYEQIKYGRTCGKTKANSNKILSL